SGREEEVMTSQVRSGIALAALHAVIVSSLGAKLLADRATRPRVWVRAAPADPALPIRGRYVSLRIEVAVDEGFGLTRRLPGGRPPSQLPQVVPVSLAVRNGRLLAIQEDAGSPAVGRLHASVISGAEPRAARLDEPIAFFIPEHVADPSVRRPGEELWVEVTVPRRGAPRPIRLGVKTQGVLAPLDLR